MFQLQRVGAADGPPLLVKFATADWHGAEDVLLNREYRLFERLRAPCLLTPVELRAEGASTVAVYRDVAGAPATPELLSTWASATTLLDAVLALCAPLQQFHREDVIIAGLSPQSFLCDADGGEVVLADAPFARELGSASPEDSAYWAATSYLAYAAPEVVGRAAMPIDARADLYALGGVLYHLLSGGPPFATHDPSELIQCHLAKTPPMLAPQSDRVSRAFADLVMKLLAKDPEQRPASVVEFEAAATRALCEFVRPTRRQRSEVRTAIAPRHISEKLYGIEEGVRLLSQTFARTRTIPALALIRGDAGVGKTSLILQTQKLVGSGHFCRGRFDHTLAATPLSGWASALTELANSLLTRSGEELANWQEKLALALGDNASLLASLVPEWSLILGNGPRRSSDEMDGALNRIAVAIHSLLRCFARPDAPLVLALDDLQWADQSSLRILECMLALREPINLVVLAGIRSTAESGAEHAASLLRVCETAEVPVVDIELCAWQLHTLRDFVSDSFRPELAANAEFCDSIFERTQGNPLFVHAFVKTLIARRLVGFDAELDTWLCDVAAIRALPPADSVVDFLVRKIASLPAELAHALQTAACLGTSFSLSEFMCAAEMPREQVAECLERVIAEGLLRVQPGNDESYEFTHDRVLEACRRSLSDAEYAARCLALGRALSIAARTAAELEHRIAGYYNAARTLVEHDDERIACAELNLKAGIRAKHSSAFSQAFDYFLHGLDFLAALDGTRSTDRHARAWQQHAALTRSLFEEAAASAAVNGKFELMHELCATLLARVTSPLERARIHEIRLGGLSAERRFAEAVEAAREVLGELGVTFPQTPRLYHLIAAYVGTRRRLFSGPVERLCDLPANRATPLLQARSRILRAMYAAAYFGHSKLFPLVVCRHIDHSLAHGNDEYSCVTYVGLAIVLCARQDFDNAFRLGDVILRLLKQLSAERHTAQTLMGVYGFIYPWKHHLRDALPFYAQAITSGLRYGEFEFTGYLITIDAMTRLHCGFPLSELAPEFEQQRAKVVSLQQARSIVLMQVFCQQIHDLRDKRGASTPLAGPLYVEEAMLPRCLDPLDHNLAFHHYMAKMLLCFLLGDHANALAAARRARPYYEEGTFGLYLGAVYVFWEALVWLVAADKQLAGRRRALQRASRACRQLARWARGAPMNFQHKYHIVQAELCRMQERWDDAAQHFERAIELSQTHGYMHETAFALERAAELYLRRGMQRLGRSYLRECYATYARWGAAAINRRLERSFPQHFAVLARGSDTPESTGLALLSDDLDYRVLLRSSQAISGEVRLPRLLERLLRTMFEHAGAQRALLILEQRGQLIIEAEADVDRGDVEFVRGERADESARLCAAVLHYVSRTGATVVLGDAMQDERFRHDPYMQRCSPKSLLCTPLNYQGRLVGLAYLENNRVSHVFTRTRVEIASLLASQAAISIASARFHALELEAQQAKINPHFLFNALSAIAELAIEDGERTERAIVQLSQLYRYMLATSIEQRATLRQELEIVRSYLELEKLRFGSKLEYSITCDERVADLEIPGLLLQPLVENAIRHGIAPKMSQGTVWVHAIHADEHCHIVVQDDGDGQGHGTSGSGFGLRSVQERCALRYGRRYAMAISRRGGYRVELRLPLLEAVSEHVPAPAGAN